MSGRGEDLWPRPGRIFAAARAMTFGQLAGAIDDAFGRWDLAHLHTVDLADGTLLIGPGDTWDDSPQGRPVERTDRTKLSRLALGEQFAYTFDLGDDWTHLCTVGDQRIDPYEALGEVPDRPAAYWGWGSLPDQYGRRFDEDVWRDARAAGPAQVRPAADPLRLGTAPPGLSARATESCARIGHPDSRALAAVRGVGGALASVRSPVPRPRDHIAFH